MIYDPLYRGQKLQDGKTNTSVATYDNVGNLQQFAFPNFNVGTGFDLPYVNQFDPDGNPQQSFDGRNLETDLQYTDPENLLTNVMYDNQGAGNLDVNVVYDTYGRVSQRSDGAATVVYQYDDLDEVLSVTTTYVVPAGQTAFTKEVSYTYNNDGTRATMTTPAGLFSYFYDNAARLTKVSFPWSANLKYSYFSNNWLAAQSPVSFADTSSLIWTQYNYNARGQLTSLSNQAIDSSDNTYQLSTFSSFTYDGVGNRLGMSVDVPTVQGLTTYAAHLNGTLAWTYSGQDQLTEEYNHLATLNGGSNDHYLVSFTNLFGLDAAENLTTYRNATLGYNADNQLANNTYDGEGNPTTYGTNTGLAYDPEDRLISLPGYYTAGYFADGLRAWKQTQTNYTSRTYFLYDGDTLLAELNSAGQLVTVYGFGGAGLVQRHVPGGTTYAYTFDPSGNLVQRTSSTALNNQGIPADFTTYYDAFGAQLGQISSASGAQFPSPDAVGFGGQWGYYTDNETDPVKGSAPQYRQPLCLLGARYYDPTVGRFLTRDPIGYEGGINLYAYAGSNPIMHSDPSGLQEVKLLPAEAAQQWIANTGQQVNDQLSSNPVYAQEVRFALGAATTVATPFVTSTVVIAGTIIAAGAGGAYLAYNHIGVPLAMHLLGPQTLPTVSANAEGWASLHQRARARITIFDPSNLNHEFSRHALDFGITGTWNRANALLFKKAVIKHLATAAIVKPGTFRGTMPVTHYFNPATGVWAAVNSAHKFVAGWKLSASQIQYLLTNGNIQ